MIKTYKFFSTNRTFFITFFIIVSCFWIFWYPGVKVATDYHLSSDTGILSFLPWSWRQFSVGDGMGEYTIFTLWSQPLHVLSELMNWIHLSNEIQTKLMGAAILFFGLLGIWKLLSYFKINDLGKSIGSAFFILNSFFLLMFDGGQFSLNLAYITLPYAILSFLNLLKTGKWKERVRFSLSCLLISIFDIRIIFLLTIIIGVYLIFKIFFPFNIRKCFKLLLNLLISFIFTFLILIGFHAYWILPSFFARTPQLPMTYGRLSQVDFLSFSSVGHSIFLQQPHWFKNVFGQIGQLKFEFIFIPILVFLSPILIKKNISVGFWLVIALLGIFLSKGSQDPFPGIYLWLFANFPGFSLFRDPVKFYFLTALAYSILIGFTIYASSKLNNRFTKFGIKVLPFLTFLYLIFLARPIYLGWMMGMISQPIYLNDYKQMANVLENDHKFSRILWLPSQPPLSYTSLDHPPVEASRLADKRPFAAGTIGTYETLNFLRESPIMYQLLEVSGIGYLAYPFLDPRRDDMSSDHIRYHHTFLRQLLEKPWLSDLTKYSKVPLLKVSKVQDLFFITPNLWWVIGSDSIYNDVAKNPELALSKNAFVFAEEYPGLGTRINELPEAKIVLNKKTDLDLTASLIDSSDLIFPAKNLDFDPDKTSGWWKREAADLVRWRSFLQEKYGIDNQDFDLGGGWAIGEGNLEFRIQNSEFRKDKILLARVMESSRSGKLSFYQGNTLIGVVSTKIDEATNVRWFEVGKLTSVGNLTISSEGDINVVNTLAVLDEKKWAIYQSKVKQLQGRIVNFDEKYAEDDNNSTVSYQKINPTKYRVIVSNLTKPSFLVFSQNYDGLWKTDGGQASLPVYSLLNGFRIQGDGEYIVEFEPQKYVYRGLVITGATIVILILLLLKTRKAA